MTRPTPDESLSEAELAKLNRRDIGPDDIYIAVPPFEARILIALRQHDAAEEAVWWIAPVKPTEAMLRAGSFELSGWVAPAMHSGQAWTAMRLTSPTPAADNGEHQ